MFIPMHKIDDEFMAGMPERVKMSMDNLPLLVETSRTKAMNLALLSNAASSAAGFTYLVDPKSDAVSQSLEISRQALNAMFACVVNTSSATVVQFGKGEPVSLTGKPDESALHAGRWLDAFYLNLIFGDLDELRKLCHVPTELLRASSTIASEYAYLYKDVLCSYIHGEPDVIDQIIATLRATDPERPDIVNRYYMLTKSVPNIQLFYYAVTSDQKFGAAMQTAVQCHRDYWGDSLENSRSARGFISLDLLGLAVLGMDSGLSFDVESPYLPMHLIKSL
ncbi:immunity 49 family protein [Undibacterium sp. Di27W]|uniref:immunity 49 family protein n=1 Tax=Undibacterium sp. Di27W TaxID=3413036 RepID=UPI003BF25967